MKLSRFAFLFLLFVFSCRKDPKVIADDAAFTRFYGTNGDETGRDVKVLDNGDIVLCGYGQGPNGGNDMFLMKTGSDGTEKWRKYFGGSGDENCWSFDKTADGGFIIGGTTNSFGNGGVDMYLVKTDADGNETWRKTYGGIHDEFTSNVRALPNGFLVCGSTNSGNDDNIWVLRLDAGGDSIWSYNYGGNGPDGAMCSCAGPNNSHVIIGYTSSTSTNSADGFLLLLNDNGQQTAYYNYGTPGYDEPHAVVPATDGNGWIISGHQGQVAPLSTHNVFIRAIGANGTERWNYIYGGADHDGSEQMCVSGNTYALVARSNSRPGFGEDVYFLQVNADGSLKKESWLGTDADDAGYGVTSDHGTFVLSGYSRGGSLGGKDIYLQKIAAE